MAESGGSSEWHHSFYGSPAYEPSRGAYHEGDELEGDGADAEGGGGPIDGAPEIAGQGRTDSGPDVASEQHHGKESGEVVRHTGNLRETLW